MVIGIQEYLCPLPIDPIDKSSIKKRGDRSGLLEMLVTLVVKIALTPENNSEN